ncbi:MAG: hypothetical protein CL661_09585 [Bacteroidetes bacterium]|nr:hypothetical protein [Bacteroidota bacterium]|tara:strand:- start:985 stop:2019 length:1035 start_codon:yes stop_codon:yes gene_type:complete
MIGTFNKAIITTIIFLIGLSSFAQKTDTIIHVNGNVLLGEIKKLDNGIITFKMDGMGTIKFQLDKVYTFSSEKHFQVIMRQGIQYYGTFDTSGISRRVKIRLLNGTESLKVEDIIEMYPIKKNFWLRTSGTFSLGFNFSKGSDIASITSSGKIDYRNRKTFTQLNWSDNTTVQSDTLNSNKTDVSFDIQKLLKKRWYIGFNAEGSSNSELGYDLRLLVGTSIINYLIQNYHNRMYASIGASGNREWASGSEDPSDNLEGLIGLNYHYFKYTDPEINISTYINTYPNLTTAGRWRVNYYLDAKVEVINDFEVGINFYYNYDNKPVSSDASTNDYGITTTISYSFH